MSNITIRCSVCGRDTTLNNVQPGRKIFCLHCGHKITDSYQQGMELSQTSQPSPVPEENVDPQTNVNPHKQQEETPISADQPDWRTEPFIRINWKRIIYTLKVAYKGVVAFSSKLWEKLREALRSRTISTNAAPQTPEEQQSAPPIFEAAPQKQAPEQGESFGSIDRRQQRIDESFSKSFADSGAVPDSTSDIDYAQQRIDKSFSKSFADSGAIPASTSDANYTQQRIDESFSKSFQEDDNKQA